MRNVTMLLMTAALMVSAPAQGAPDTPSGVVCDAHGWVYSFMEYGGQSSTFWTVHLDGSGTCQTPAGLRTVTLEGYGGAWTCEDSAQGPHWDGLSLAPDVTLTDPATGGSQTTTQSWDSASRLEYIVPLGDSGPVQAFLIGQTLPIGAGPNLRTQGAATLQWSSGMYCGGATSVDLHWVV